MCHPCIIAAALCAALAAITPARADIDWSEGSWRLELSGGTGVHSGSTDRSGNTLIVGSVEYELPFTSRTTLGLRLIPLFLYDQDDDDNDGDDADLYDRDDDDLAGDGDLVYGAGVGITGRIYAVKAEQRGFFVEISAAALLHDEKINGNSSHFNFLTGAGVGYKLRSHLHAVLKYEHISNAGIGDHNRSANSIGLGIGYMF